MVTVVCMCCECAHADWRKNTYLNWAAEVSEIREIENEMNASQTRSPMIRLLCGVLHSVISGREWDANREWDKESKSKRSIGKIVSCLQVNYFIWSTQVIAANLHFMQMFGPGTMRMNEREESIQHTGCRV